MRLGKWDRLMSSGSVMPSEIDERSALPPSLTNGMTAIDLIAAFAVRPRRMKATSATAPTTNAKVMAATASLCCLMPVTTYSALEVAYVFGVPPSGGKVWGLDAIPPEGGTPNFCGGQPSLLACAAPALVLRKPG